MISALGCAANTGADESNEATATTDSTSEALSAFQWSSDYQAGNSSSYMPASVATYQAGTMMVHEGDDENDTDMYWAWSSDGVTWSDDVKIANMATGTPVRLAQFNDKLYMTHTGGTLGNTDVYLSVLNTNTGGLWAWKPDILLRFKSVGSPSIVQFQDLLYFFGTTPGTNQIWVASMNSSGSLGPVTPIPGAFSPTAPSVVVTGGTGRFSLSNLMIAYRQADNQVMTVTRSLTGKGWGSPVSAGGLQSTVQPAIANYQGNIHMVYTAPPSGNDLIMWSYLSGSTWASPTSIASQRMQGTASLSAKSDRLVMVHGSSIHDHSETFPDFNTKVYAEIFQ